MLPEDAKRCWKKIEAYNRFRKNFTVAHDWLLLEKKGISIISFFQNNFSDNVAIYGYGKLGQLLYQELESAGIEVSFILDRRVGQLKEKVPIYALQEKFPQADLIVVTTDYFYQVKDRVNELKYDTEVIYLGDIMELMFLYVDEKK